MSTRSHHLLAGVATTAVAAALTTATVALPLAAQAEPGPSTTRTTSAAAAQAKADRLDDLQARCDAQITRRTTTLDELARTVTADSGLPPTVAGPLQARLADDKAGLTSLRGQIDAATDVATARGLCQQIVNDYRVYVLVVPQVRLSLASAHELAMATKLDGVQAKLATLVAEAKARGRDVGDAESLLADLTTNVDAARTKATPVATTVLALTPAQYDAGTARPVLEAQRDAVAGARGELGKAGDDAQQVVRILRAGR